VKTVDEFLRTNPKLCFTFQAVIQSLLIFESNNKIRAPSGFTAVKMIRSPSTVRAMLEASYSIANGTFPYQPIQPTWKQKLSILICRMTEIAFPASANIITMIVKKTI